MADASGSNSIGGPGGLPATGDVIAGKYLLEGIIGRGGMGVVFAARHQLLQQPVAIKFLGPNLSPSAPSVTRFFNEARATARIQNDHVCRVIDFGVLDSGHPYLVMERLEGRDLAKVIAARGPLPIELAVDYCLQALEAIAEAHVLGIVHRDLKPANLFVALRPDGSTRIKVLDFGVSKIASADPSPSITTTAAPLGSPAYMSPEQVRDPKSVDARTDLWAMGVILYEMLAGKSPFASPTLGETYAEILERDPPPVRSRRPDVPAALVEAVGRCLRRDREARFADAAELAAALVGFGSGQASQSLARIRGVARGGHATVSLPSPASSLPETRTRPGRRRGRGLWIALAALLVAGPGLFIAHRSRRARLAMPVETSATAPAQSPPLPPRPLPPPVAPVTAPAAPRAAEPIATPTTPARRRPRRAERSPVAKPSPAAPGGGILDDRQ